MKVEDEVKELTDKLGLTGIPKRMVWSQFVKVIGIIHGDLMELCDEDKDDIDNYFKDIMGVEK
jgi:hypothetical protein